MSVQSSCFTPNTLSKTLLILSELHWATEDVQPCPKRLISFRESILPFPASQPQPSLSPSYNVSGCFQLPFTCSPPRCCFLRSRLVHHPLCRNSPLSPAPCLHFLDLGFGRCTGQSKWWPRAVLSPKTGSSSKTRTLVAASVPMSGAERQPSSILFYPGQCWPGKQGCRVMVKWHNEGRSSGQSPGQHSHHCRQRKKGKVSIFSLKQKQNLPTFKA